MSDIDTSAGYQPGTGFAGEAKPAEGGQNPAEQQGGDGVSNQQPNDTQASQSPTADTPTDQPKGDRLSALIKERRDSRSETDELRRTVAELQQSVSGLSPQAQQDAEAWQNPHDPTEAPMDHLRAEIEHLGGVVSQARQDVGHQLEQQQQQQALTDYERGLTMEIGTVAQQVPELAAAHQAVAAQFVRMAQMQGLPPAQAMQTARNAMLGAYLQHAQAGKDAVTATIEMAQALGFQAGQQQAPGGDILGAAGAPSNGQAAPNAQQQIARGQAAAATSLGGATGNSGATSPPDLQALVRKSRDQLLADGKKDLNRMRALLRGEV